MGKYWELDMELEFAKHTTEQLESVEMFAGELMEDLTEAKAKGMGVVPVDEVLIKVRGIFHLLLNANKELHEHLANVSSEVNSLEREEKASKHGNA